MSRWIRVDTEFFGPQNPLINIDNIAAIEEKENLIYFGGMGDHNAMSLTKKDMQRLLKFIKENDKVQEKSE